MPLIKEGNRIEDPWVFVGDDDPIPDEGPVIVGYGRWRQQREILLGRNAPIGIRLAGDEPPSLISDDLDRFAVIALEFSKFTDGRAYSHARLLRERHGYAGEIRAVGDVLRDQFLFMQRCGFDAFQVVDEKAVEGWSRAISEIGVWYQPAADDRTPIPALRRRRPASGANAETKDAKVSEDM